MSKRTESKGISAQKQTAIDSLVREAAGKAAVVRMLHSQYIGATPHQLFLLSDGHTVFVNLKKEPMSAHRSEKPNAKYQAEERKREARQEARLERKAKAEAKKAEKAKAKAAAKKEAQ